MGKKKSGRTGAGGDSRQRESTAFLLRVPMHCRCHGCTDKIRAGVKDLALNRSYGVQALDQSELGTKGELKVLATGDPDRLRRRLHKSTGKTVDLVLLNPTTNNQQQADKDDAAAEKELMQALLLRGGLQPPPAAHRVLPGSAAPQQAAYNNPWALEMMMLHHHHHPQQQQQAEAEAYPAAAYQYPGAAYAYPQQGLGAYGGGGWPGHGAGY